MHFSSELVLYVGNESQHPYILVGIWRRDVLPVEKKNKIRIYAYSMTKIRRKTMQKSL